MGFFSFIESFFFLSLGITFVLIFLMVFHFKQRVEQLEKKSENMLEVCNGLVQQIHGLKTFCISNQNSSSFIPPSSSRISENITFSTSSPIPIPDLDPSSGSAEISNTFQKIVVEDFDDSEEEEEDEEEEDEDIDVSDELDSSPESLLRLDSSPESLLRLDSSPESLLRLDQTSFPLDTEEISSELQSTIIEDFGINAPGIEEVEVNLLEEHPIELPKENVDNEEEIKSEEIQPEENKLEEDIDIKNLSLQQLRQLVSNKGLSTNANKMKKQELVQLLQKTSTEPKTSTEKSLQDLAFLL